MNAMLVSIINKFISIISVAHHGNEMIVGHQKGIFHQEKKYLFANNHSFIICMFAVVKKNELHLLNKPQKTEQKWLITY